MTTVHLTDTVLAVRFSRSEKLAGLLRDFDVSLSGVRAACVEPDGMAAATGMRAPGLGIPGLAKIGIWRRGGRRTVVVVRRGRPALHVELSGHRLTALLLDADDAVPLARALNTLTTGER